MRGVENPPVLTAEDEVLLDRAWAKVAPPRAEDVIRSQWSKPVKSEARKPGQRPSE
jgi:hypothetical protein